MKKNIAIILMPVVMFAGCFSENIVRMGDNANVVYIKQDACVVNATVHPEEFETMLDWCADTHRKYYYLLRQQ